MISRLSATLAGNKRERLVLLVLGLVTIAAGLGLRDPWPADEPRFALIARDMVASGDWLIPRVGGELYSDKPPLFMWMTAVFYWITGDLRIAFLLPSLLAGVGMLMLTYDLARRLWGPQTALHAGLLLLLCVQFTAQARSAQLDALVSFWITLGLYGLLRHLVLGPDWRWYFVGWFAMGLGVITKGVGILPVFLFIPWLILKLYRPDWLPPTGGRSWRWWAGPLVMLAAVSLWLLPMLIHVAISGSPELIAYRDDILFRQTAERYANSWGHIRPLWYYLLNVIPWAWFPLTLLLPWLLPAWWRRMRDGDAVTWLLLGWVVCVLLFFSLSPGKRGVYILPAVPAMALAAAPLITRLLNRSSVQRVALIFVVLVAVGAAALLAALLIFMPGRAAELSARYEIELWGLIAAIGGLALFALLAGWRAGGAGMMTIFLLGMWQLHGWLGYPLFDPVRSGSDLMKITMSKVSPGQELALVGWKEQFLLYVDRPVYHFGYRRDVAAEYADAVAWLAGAGNRRLMVPRDELAPCLDPRLAQQLAYRHRRDWVLVGPEALKDDCRSGGVPAHVRYYVPAID